MIKTTQNIKTEKLTVPPNYPVNVKKMYRDQLEEKSSFLTKGSIDNPLLPALVKGRKGSHGVEFTLNPMIDPNNKAGDILVPYSVNTGVISKNSTPNIVNLYDTQEFYGKGSVRVQLAKNNQPYGKRSTLYFGRATVIDFIESALDNVLKAYRSLVAFLLAYCQALHGKSAEYICTFFGYAPYPLGENVTTSLYHHIPFYDSIHCSDLTDAENTITTITHSIDKTGSFPANIPEFPMVFSFENNYNITNLKIVVEYDHKTRTKTLNPYMLYIQNGSNEPENFGFIATKVIPWSRTDFDGKEVVITSNVEFAYLNQTEFLNAGKVLVCYPEPFGHYELMDYSVFKKASKVTLLIANFDGMTFAEACIAAKPLAAALQEHVAKEKLSYFTMQIAYPEIPASIQSTAQLSAFLKKSPARVEACHVFFDKTEFDGLLEKAMKEILRKFEAQRDIDFLASDCAQMDTTTDTENSRYTKDQWLVRGALEKGEYTELIAPEKMGKSNIAVSLAMLITNPRGRHDGLVPGRYLTVSNGVNGKVVYLDAENGQGRFYQMVDRFRKAFWPYRKEGAEVCDSNLVYHDLRGSNKIYAQRENHPEILKLVDDAIHAGTDGMNVDLVIIDTKRGFTKKNIALEAQFTELVEAITKQGIAVLVIHHTAKDSAVGGAGRSDVTCNKTGLIQLERDYVSLEESQCKGKLYHPIKVKLRGYRAYQTALDSEAFYMRFLNDKWELVERDETQEVNGIDTPFKPVIFDEAKIIKEMSKEYKSACSCRRIDIADYLGISEDTLKAWEAGKK